jgi:dipeptidyl aminopeptidase/acylaminoacyl peptidase
MTERFVAKGRDGVTDIWGIVVKPSNFDKKKRYPIIENIYAGPHDSFVPKAFRPWFGMHQLAELGFIVVQIDGMGTSNRGKAFHDVCWKNIADAGFPDRILWMKALAKKMPQVDINRVGIYGTSAGGQNSAGAVLWHPEFYKVAVSSCGCHDNRIDKQWWNEQWMGYPVGPHYDAQSNITNAAKLKGHLMLIVGENDRNVPPESTYRFADALIKAKKEFELVVIPGADHTNGGPYGERKRRDFFVRWLLNKPAPFWNE